MSDAKLRLTFEALGRALTRLEETQEVPPDDHPFLIDATIQRFEFCFELFWKALKRLLAYEGVEVASPRQTLQGAFQQGWLADESLWLDMLDDRNRTSHAYDEAAAEAIFERIRTYAPSLSSTYDRIRHDYSDVLSPSDPDPS